MPSLYKHTYATQIDNPPPFPCGTPLTKTLRLYVATSLASAVLRAGSLRAPRITEVALLAYCRHDSSVGRGSTVTERRAGAEELLSGAFKGRAPLRSSINRVLAAVSTAAAAAAAAAAKEELFSRARCEGEGRREKDHRHTAV